MGENSKRLTPVKAIRAKCLDCCGWQAQEVRLCPSKLCPLHRFRMGKEERDELYCRKQPREKTIENTHDFLEE